MDCVAVCLDNAGEGSRWPRLLMIFNCSALERELALPEGNWQILTDAGSAFLWREERFVSEKTKVEPMSALILGA